MMWTQKPLLKVPSKRYYANVLYCLNFIHIAVGLLCLGLALSQFAPVNLGSTFVDFRLLNFIHIVTGSAGMHMLKKHFGSVAVGALYCTSFSLGLWTCAFYSYSCAEEVRVYYSMLDIQKSDGGEEFITQISLGNQIGKIVICSTMLILGFGESVISFVSGYSLNKLASDSYSNLKNAYSATHTRQMAFVAFMKAFFSLAAMILGAYLESLYKAKGHFIKIGWQELAGCVGFVSAFLDLRALYSNSHNLLYLKIAMTVGVTSAVFSLKTLDYAMVNHFVIDLRDYSNFDSTLNDASALSDSAGFSEKDRQQVFVKFVIHACVIACLVITFALSVISSVACASYVEWSSGSYNEKLKIDNSWRISRNRLGFLQTLWGVGLIALTIISLVTWNFSKGYEGGSGILWLGCLFIAAGCVTANQVKTFAISVYVVSCISSILALEYSLYSLNFIFQAVRNQKFINELKDPVSDSTYSTHVGRIVLYSVQAGLLFLEFFTASYTAYAFGFAVGSLPSDTTPATKSSSHRLHGSLCFLSFFHFVYAFITIAISIAAEVVIWKYSIPVQPVVFVTNGVVVFVCVIVQCAARRKRQFLIPSTILNTVSASIAFFVIAPYTTYLYQQVAAYVTAEEMKLFDDSTPDGIQKRILHKWIIALTASILCLAMLEYVVSIVSGMICSFILHNINQPTLSDLRFSTMRSQAPTLPHYLGTVPGKMITIPNNVNRRNGQIPERYFGSNYRTYAEQMYNPNDINMFNGNGGAGVRESYYVQGHANHSRPEPTTKVNGHAQTNIRHVFANGHSRYMSPY